MKFAYPQNPTHAVTAIKRLDESSDSGTSQSNLERPQDIAVVGETVPLIYCNRSDWGGGLGVNGGVWLSPRLIQLGVRTTDLSMMYLLSQGQVSAIDREKTYWGYNKVGDVEPDSQVCTAYEDVPACLDLDYDPGGSIDWTEVINRPGPAPRTNGFSYTTQTNKAVKVTLNFTIDCTVTFSGPIVCGNDWTYSWETSIRLEKGSCTYGGDYSYSESNYEKARTGDKKNCSYGYNSFTGQWSYCKDGPYFQQKGLNLVNTGNWTEQACSNDGLSEHWSWLATTQGLNRNAQIYFTSGVYYSYEVISTTDGEVKQSGNIWLNHGSNSFEVDSLAPDQYQIQFTPQQYGWTEATTYCILSPNEDMVSQVNSYQNAQMGYSNQAPGRGSLGGTSQATEVVYNTLDFPDLPGGDQQIVGGLSDLTMFGIRGNINLLRPDDGPDYFLQSHVFVEQGIQVERLLTGDVGPSKFYGDLVNYLFNKAQVLKTDQIDRESLVQANRLTQAYGLLLQRRTADHYQLGGMDDARIALFPIDT